MALNIASMRDTKWLTLEVCRQFQRGTCSRDDEECKFAHPPKSCQVENGRVIACFDSLKVRHALVYVSYTCRGSCQRSAGAGRPCQVSVSRLAWPMMLKAREVCCVSRHQWSKFVCIQLFFFFYAVTSSNVTMPRPADEHPIALSRRRAAILGLSCLAVYKHQTEAIWVSFLMFALNRWRVHALYFQDGRQLECFLKSQNYKFLYWKSAI